MSSILDGNRTIIVIGTLSSTRRQAIIHSMVKQQGDAPAIIVLGTDVFLSGQNILDNEAANYDHYANLIKREALVLVGDLNVVHVLADAKTDRAWPTTARAIFMEALRERNPEVQYATIADYLKSYD